MVSELGLWQRCNRQLVAKIIGECAYEECWQPVEETGGHYQLQLASGYHYRFRAYRSVWGWLRVEPESLTVSSGNESAAEVISAPEFILQAGPQLGMDEIVLAGFLEEIHNTLYSMMRQQQQLARYRASELVALNPAELQGLLEAHPKALANRGRLGWGAEELDWYAPESLEPVRLRLLLVHRAMCTLGHSADAAPWQLLEQQVTSARLAEIRAVAHRRKRSWQDYVPVPVHPWQWQRHIRLQYQDAWQNGKIMLAGELPDNYLPQQSLRTLTNIGSEGNLQPQPRYDIKLPLTILNTSCYRGIPGRHIATGAALSQWLFDTVAGDELLSRQGLIVQREVCGVHCPHPIQSQLAAAPYRYQEMLGVVWRESLQQYTEPDQQGILLATLMQTDTDGNSLIAEYVRRSGLSAEAWLRDLFRVTVIPLYHLMCRYGVGLVAHGQNISLVLENGRPVRAAIKDFHGDLRLVDQDFPETGSLPGNVRAALTRLPAEYLLHDLVTGHFVTTLRFISPLLQQDCGVSEPRFYRILADILREYQASQPELASRFALFPLFTGTFLRICINRVRFRIGYGDSTERPLPELGTPLNNPLLMEPAKENDYDTAS